MCVPAIHNRNTWAGGEAGCCTPCARPELTRPHFLCLPSRHGGSSDRHASHASTHSLVEGRGTHSVQSHWPCVSATKNGKGQVQWGCDWSSSHKLGDGREAVAKGVAGRPRGSEHPFLLGKSIEKHFSRAGSVTGVAWHTCFPMCVHVLRPACQKNVLHVQKNTWRGIPHLSRWSPVARNTSHRGMTSYTVKHNRRRTDTPARDASCLGGCSLYFFWSHLQLQLVTRNSKMGDTTTKKAMTFPNMDIMRSSTHHINDHDSYDIYINVDVCM